MLDDLKQLIAIKSVEGAAEKNAPFGRALREALDWFLAKAKSYGLETGELDGYCGWAEYGAGKTCIGILCHLDVVPANAREWTNDPFTMTILNGRAYGRGAADDKGPLAACLHVLKELKETGVPLAHRVRLIAGCNEETGSACLKRYREYGEIPVVSIVPDADFPVINSEKGILHLALDIPADDAFLADIAGLSGGERPNVVPDEGRIFLRKTGGLYAAVKAAAGGGAVSDCLLSPAAASRLLTRGIERNGYSFIESGDLLEIAAKGVAGHAMSPEKADNALVKLFCLLSVFAPAGGTLSDLCRLFGAAPTEEAFGLGLSDAQSGAVTASLGIAALSNGTVTLTLDFRLPVSVTPKTVKEALRRHCPAGTAVRELRYAPNLYRAADSRLVTTLLDVYRQCTGDGVTPPVQTGGGTYARELPEALAFGPTFPGAVTNIHNADECIEIAALQKLTEIYRRAIIELDKQY
ncbi:MAG: Sapep family Mn(2+)-dependent dipeptidase [Clostridiales bacterium]|jgi:succinyl-diaminopimelate desuccinylase|nr:Sapep family Mn(2+)-dependent dipeptidase [Clostridiales bacterium]